MRMACRSALKGTAVSVGKGYERVTKEKHVKIHWEYVLFSTMQCNAGRVLFLDTSDQNRRCKNTMRGLYHQTYGEGQARALNPQVRIQVRIQNSESSCFAVAQCSKPKFLSSRASSA